MRTRNALIAALVFVAVATGCVEADDAGFAREPTRWSVAPNPLLTIGVADGSPEYMFHQIRGVGLLPHGRTVVADGGSGSLRVYDSEGRYVHQMGGTGSGPGEFLYLSAIGRVGGDTLRVYDSEALRLTTFLASGELVNSLQMQTADGIPELYLGSYTDGGHALGWIKRAGGLRDRLSVDSMRIGRFTSEGDLSGLLAKATGMHRLGSPVPLSPHLLAGMVGDSVVFTDGVEGTLQIIGPNGEMVRTLQVDGADWTFDHAMSVVEEHLSTERADRFRSIGSTPGVDVVPEFSAMLADDQNRIWLKLYDPETDSHWLGRRLSGGEWVVIDTRGREIARVAMPSDFKLVDVQGQRVAGIVTDDLGVQRVRIYRLNRGPA